jgi:hypothetical protein
LRINWNRFLELYINYSVNQNYCYILIIPGFGIISTVVAANSNKSIFGQNGPWIGLTQYTQRTIFGQFYSVRSFIIYLLLLNNPQITKALPRGAVGAPGSVTIIIFLTLLSARKASAHFFALACGPGQGVRKNCWLKMNFSKHIRREHLTKEGLKSPLTGINKNCFK